MIKMIILRTKNQTLINCQQFKQTKKYYNQQNQSLNDRALNSSIDNLSLINQNIDDGISQNNDDDFINELTQNDELQKTGDPDDLGEETRRRINEELHICIQKFTQELMSKTQRKTVELAKLIKLLQEFRIQKDLLQQNKKQPKEQLDDNNFAKLRGNQNNREKIIEDSKNHQMQGTQMEFIVCDNSINPFFFSFNQTLIFIKNDKRELDSAILNYFDLYLRLQKQQIFITSLGQGKSLNSLYVQFGDGLLQFQIKCGQFQSDPDRLFFEILKLCCELNPVFKNICAFLSYWADRRGILNNQFLPENALYCMVIEFFQLNDMLPRFFDMKYCPWPLAKIKLMNKHLESHKIDQEQLKNEFSCEEYTIINKKGLKNRINHQKQIFQRVHFHSFPKGKDKDFVLGVWERQKKQNFKNNHENNNLGVLVVKFFHYILNEKVQRRKIDIATSDSNPYQQEIGYMVMNPIKNGHCLTKNLCKQYKNGQESLPKAFKSVNQEFQRAYTLITQCKFLEICQKRKTFVEQ